MRERDRDTDRTGIFRERRELLKAGATLVAAPVAAAMASAQPAQAESGPAKAVKNVLIVSASPRDEGNSDILCDEFLRGAAEAGHRAEKIRLSDLDINFCLGCCSCISDPGSCVQDDDMAPLMKKALEADVLVLASPVYFMTFNARMKNFIDRFCPIYTMVRDLDVYFIASAAGGRRSIDSVVAGFRVFTDCLYGARERGVVACTGIWDEGGVKGTGSLREAYDMGRNV
ncbi:FMN-dependent NADH-azoreductase [Pseudodesulfovibrio hydrargyri]|uniref:FMN-dependent NADH-azoreductase n=1 Tax=Pseudodesulfovibrio hydrargyri TaxID=2125990 RepID=A0A1J5MWD8_9BACT|nr:flavodoxin family protein [Pseudodesulfovibrio hydrargyri]OIQ50132.1 FMN-dependent NADH-azoreductase [Pseudodesulfovibrio hydrargyri]